MKNKLPEIQKRFWMDWKLNPDRSSYNMSFEYRIFLDLNLAALIKALKNYVFFVNPLCVCQFTKEGNDVSYTTIPNLILNLRMEDNLLEQKNFSEMRDNFFFEPFDLENGHVYRFLISKNKDSYSLLVSFHHVVMDTVTYSLFLKSISDTYKDICDGTYQLIPSESSVQAFLNYEQEALNQVNMDSCLENFSSDSLHVHLFLEDDATKLESLLTGRSLPFETDIALFRKIESFVKTHNTTFFRVVMATYASLLKFYSGQSRISINYPIHLLPEALKGLSGSFVNGLPMSIDFSVPRTFLDILNQIKKHRKLARSYQHVPYQDILAFLREKKRIDAQDSANVCLSEALGMLRVETLVLQGAKIDPMPLEKFEPMFDITLCFAVTKHLLLQVDYNSSKLSEDFIKEFSNHFIRFLEFVIERPNVPITTNMIFREEDFQKNIRDLQVKEHDKKIIKPLGILFSETASQYGKRTGLVLGEKNYDYETLEKMSNQWASYIRATYQQVYNAEMPKDTLIGLCIDRTENMILGILGILKAGGAYVPIDPHYPKENVSYILQDSGLSLILTHQIYGDELLQAFPSDYKIFMDDHAVLRTVYLKPKTYLDIDIDPKNLAYVIYTSGSTGKPKGVMVSHENVVRLFTATSQHYSFNEQDVWSLFHSFSFDFSVWEIWGAFLYGGTLQLVPYEVSRDPREFYQWVKTKKITVLNQTPSAFQKFVEEDKKHQSDFNDVRYIIFGGEALHKKSVQAWLEKHGSDFPKLINMYGITETTVHVTYKELNKKNLWEGKSNIGMPLSDLQIYIVDDAMQLCPPFIPGEMLISGPGLARGYLNQKALTAERFIDSPFVITSRLYKSGDLARKRRDGNVDYLGRKDAQVKLRGFRIELGQIETVMTKHPSITQACVMLESSKKENLVAYYVVEKGIEVNEASIKKYLLNILPDYMVPSQLIQLSDFPINHNGKIDTNRFSEYKIKKNKKISEYNKLNINNLDSIEKKIFSLWTTILQIDHFHSGDSFFNLGGTSFTILEVREKLESEFNIKINVADLFRYTTLKKLSNHVVSLVSSIDTPVNFQESQKNISAIFSQPCDNNAIAIVGMACRLPGIKDPESYWNLLIQKKSTIRDFSAEESKISISELLLNNKSYVNRGSILEDTYCFDATFFGYSVKEAEVMDPQQRQFLECAWEALENSGNVPEKFKGDIGVFVSQGKNYYYLEHICGNSHYSNNSHDYQIMMGNEKDFLSTKISYKLNLSGPSINIQTGCSSSLVSIHVACQHLQNKNCDMALAGGISLFYNPGYLYEEGMIESPDGYCRAFDAEAKGTVAGSGMGIVVLKRLQDAIAQRDTIYAVIKGSAINNDGSNKISYTAPSIEGQVAVIEKALQNANVHPETINYIEAHGTGTPLGDPIEWKALHEVYQRYTDKKAFCTLGSVKTNIGHTDAAAGVLGLIKTVLSLKNKIIPATLNFKSLNPEIMTFNTLFCVNSESLCWPDNGNIRRAAVSSFGIGGTNAHVILEEYDEKISEDPFLTEEKLTSAVLIPFSAKNRSSLFAMAEKIKNFITVEKNQNVHSVAFTAQEGRAEFSERGYFVVNPFSAEKENTIQLSYLRDTPLDDKSPSIVFVFSTEEHQYVSQSCIFYKKYPFFREAFDYCGEIINKKYGVDIKTLLLKNPANNVDSQTPNGRLSLFAIEYAMSQLLIASGIKPDSVIASGAGACVAASVLGIFSLEEALDSVYSRNAVTETLPVPVTEKNTFMVYLKQAACGDMDFLALIGRLWSHGVCIVWKNIWGVNESVKKIKIPSYSFTHRVYKIQKNYLAAETIQHKFPVPEVDVFSIEDRLKKLWSNVLGVPATDIDNATHFFDLGGDSIASIELLGNIKKYFSVDLLFEELGVHYDFNTMLNLIYSKQPL